MKNCFVFVVLSVLAAGCTTTGPAETSSVNKRALALVVKEAGPRFKITAFILESGRSDETSHQDRSLKRSEYSRKIIFPGFEAVPGKKTTFSITTSAKNARNMLVLTSEGQFVTGKVASGVVLRVRVDDFDRATRRGHITVECVEADYRHIVFHFTKDKVPFVLGKELVLTVE